MNLSTWSGGFSYYSVAFISQLTDATTKIVTWGHIWYRTVRFEYETAPEQHLLPELLAKKFWEFCEKVKLLILFLRRPIFFANISVTKYHSEGVLLKTNGRISSIASVKDHWCSFFTSWEKKQQKSCILKKTPKFGRATYPFQGSDIHLFVQNRTYSVCQNSATKSFLKFNLGHLKKIISNHLEGGRGEINLP